LVFGEVANDEGGGIAGCDGNSCKCSVGRILEKENAMAWGHYVGAFFSGVLLVNAVPHFVKGVCGDKFPTPFSKPPGKGLSSAVVNVVWGLFNVLIGLVLWNVSQPMSTYGLTSAFAVGVFMISLQSGNHFQHKHAE
jgi:hypothetical protein